MTDNGKGDTPRPMTVQYKTFATNWDRTFDTCTAYQVGPCDNKGPNHSCAMCGQPNVMSATNYDA